MTAKEMFETLGYKYSTKTDYGSLVYRQYDFNTELGLKVTFFKDKSFEVESLNRHFDCAISLDLYRAITQQMKELGWLE